LAAEVLAEIQTARVFCSVLLLGSLPAVKIIVEKMGKEIVEQRDANNRTPLILATMAGHGEVVNHLLSVGGKQHFVFVCSVLCSV